MGDWRFQVSGPGARAIGLEQELTALVNRHALPGSGVFSLEETPAGARTDVAWTTAHGCGSVESFRPEQASPELLLLFMLAQVRAASAAR